MALLGQASGGFTESSSALRILHVGVRNTLGQLTADSFTQTNPPVVSTNVTDAPGLLTSVLGVLSGSVAFARGTAASGGGTAYKLAHTLSVASDSTLVVIDKTTPIYLTEDKSITVTASAANDLDVVCSYEEIS